MSTKQVLHPARARFRNSRRAMQRFILLVYLGRKALQLQHSPAPRRLEFSPLPSCSDAVTMSFKRFALPAALFAALLGLAACGPGGGDKGGKGHGGPGGGMPPPEGTVTTGAPQSPPGTPGYVGQTAGPPRVQ